MHEEEIKTVNKPVSIWLAFSIALVSVLLSFCFIVADYGVTTSNFDVLFEHPAAFSEFIAEAIGYSFGLPLIHLGISSCFKSKRNKNTRRLIFIGWGVVIILLNFVSRG